MTKNEQIEEMVRVIAEVQYLGGLEQKVARLLFEKGYRKASEVAREIFGELEASFCILAYPVVTAVGTINTERAEGLHIRTEDYETIKKKYTEGEKE